MSLYEEKNEEIKMMEFIIMALSFTVAIMLASVLSVAIMLNSKVLGWYMKKVNKITNQIINDSFDSDEEL